jgi:thiol-disulfide isomerase/thioredoxin
MRLPVVLGVLGALVVGAAAAALLFASVLGNQPALPTPVPPTVPPIPSIAALNPTPTPTPVSTPAGSVTPEPGVAVGQQAPPIEVTLLDGSVMNTNDFLGRPLWVNFMATWCPQCQDELPMMKRFASELDGQMTVLVVDVGEDRKAVNDFMKALNVDLPVGVDQDGSVQAEWGAYALPVHFWLDEQGIVREVVYGGAPEEIFLQAITTVVPEFSTGDVSTPLPLETPAAEPSPEVSPAT